MQDFTVAVVITACAGRERNLARVHQHLAALDPRPLGLVTVFDGCAPFADLPDTGTRSVSVEIEKHAPGREQPRNVGVRAVRRSFPDANFVWFLDSDLLFRPDVLARYREAHGAADVTRVLIGPYEWLAEDATECREDVHNDVRWESFMASGPDHVFVGDLGCALGCFSGNLVWPLDEFEWVGGFHPDLHHGRCEDGELGLRAAAARIPMSLARDARAYHVAHPVDVERVHRANARDVPLLNSWHPEVQNDGYLATEAEGARFDYQCTRPDCDLIMNFHDRWRHVSQHEEGATEFTFNDPASVRHAEAP